MVSTQQSRLFAITSASSDKKLLESQKDLWPGHAVVGKRATTIGFETTTIGGRKAWRTSVEFGSFLTWWPLGCDFAYCALCLARIKQLGQDMQAWSAVDCWRAYAKIRNQAEVIFRSSLEICGFSLLSYPKLKLDFSRPLARPAFCVQNVSSFQS